MFKVLLHVIIFLSSISLSYAQDTASVKETQEVVVYGSREEPYEAISVGTKVEKGYLLQNLGRDFSENLIVAPSVFNNRSGGGFGDSKLFVRGFGMGELGIAFNETPLEIPNGSYIFWSNWTSLAYFTEDITIAKGLPSANGMQNSVGGALMIRMSRTDSVIRLSLTSNFSNSMGFKYHFAFGKWRGLVGGTYSSGQGYFENSRLRAGSYFVNLDGQLSKRYSVSFTAFGAPQQHWQRGTLLQQQDYDQHGVRYNPDAGSYQGGPMSSAINFFFRPFFLFKQTFRLSEKTTVALDLSYLSGRGGALRSLGNPIPQRADGSLNFDSAYRYNQSNVGEVILGNGNRINARQAAHYLGNFQNKHDRPGYNLSLQHRLRSNLSLKLNQYYYYQKEENYAEVANLLGADGVADNSDPNAGTRFLKTGDRLWYNSGHISHWTGLNAAVNWTGLRWSFYTFAELMNIRHQNSETFILPVDGSNTSAVKNVQGYSFKSGLSYQLSEGHSILLNAAYLKRPPFSSAIYIRPLVAESKPQGESVYSGEAAWKWKMKKWKSSLGVFYTRRNDVTKTYSLYDPGTQAYVNGSVLGLDELHGGIELELHYQLMKQVHLGASVGFGQYKWLNNVNAVLKNLAGVPLDTINLQLKNVPTGNVPQQTYYGYVRYIPFQRTNVLLEYYRVGNYYADFNIDNSSSKFIPWKLPAYGLFNLTFAQSFLLSRLLDLELRLQVNNLLDTRYVQEALDGSGHNAVSSIVYYGMGRNFSAGIKLVFK